MSSVEVSGYWAPCQCVNHVTTCWSYPLKQKNGLTQGYNVQTHLTTNLAQICGIRGTNTLTFLSSENTDVSHGRESTSRWMAPPETLTHAWRHSPDPHWENVTFAPQKIGVAFKSSFYLHCAIRNIFFSVCISISSLLPILIFHSAASFVPDPSEFLCWVGPNHPVKLPSSCKAPHEATTTHQLKWNHALMAATAL